MNQQQKSGTLYFLVEKKKRKKGGKIIIYLQMKALMEYVVVINVFRHSGRFCIIRAQNN